MINGGQAAGQIMLEDGIPESVREQLQTMGHNSPIIVRGWSRGNFGTGQIILRNSITGVLTGGSDPRNDGHAIGW